MNETIKLDRIKSSCKAGKIVTTIFTIFAIVGCVCALIGGITILSMGEKFDEAIQTAEDAGYMSADINIGTARVFNIDISDPSNFETDIPALRTAMDSHPYSTMYGFFCIMISVLCVGLAILLKVMDPYSHSLKKKTLLSPIKS